MHNIDAIIIIVLAVISAIRSATKGAKPPATPPGARPPSVPQQGGYPQAPLGGPPAKARSQTVFTTAARPTAKPSAAAASATTMRPLEQRTIQSATVPTTNVQLAFQQAREKSEQSFLEEGERMESRQSDAVVRGQQAGMRSAAADSSPPFATLFQPQALSGGRQSLLNAIILAEVFSAPKCKTNALKKSAKFTNDVRYM